MTSGQVLFVIAHEGFHPIEYAIPKHLVEQAGFTVITASDKAGNAIAKDGSSTHVDLPIEHVDLANFKAVVFIGGPGALDHLNNPTSYALIKEAAEKELVLGAICISTRIFAASGILKGKDATGWNGDNELTDLYNQLKINYKRHDVVVDDSIVTAVGPDAAREFADNIISLLAERIE